MSDIPPDSDPAAADPSTPGDADMMASFGSGDTFTDEIVTDTLIGTAGSIDLDGEPLDTIDGLPCVAHLESDGESFSIYNISELPEVDQHQGYRDLSNTPLADQRVLGAVNADYVMVRDHTDVTGLDGNGGPITNLLAIRPGRSNEKFEKKMAERFGDDVAGRIQLEVNDTKLTIRDGDDSRAGLQLTRARSNDPEAVAVVLNDPQAAQVDVQLIDEVRALDEVNTPDAVDEKADQEQLSQQIETEAAAILRDPAQIKQVLSPDQEGLPSESEMLAQNIARRVLESLRAERLRPTLDETLSHIRTAIEAFMPAAELYEAEDKSVIILRDINTIQQILNDVQRADRQGYADSDEGGRIIERHRAGLTMLVTEDMDRYQPVGAAYRADKWAEFSQATTSELVEIDRMREELRSQPTAEEAEEVARAFGGSDAPVRELATDDPASNRNQFLRSLSKVSNLNQIIGNSGLIIDFPATLRTYRNEFEANLQFIARNRGGRREFASMTEGLGNRAGIVVSSLRSLAATRENLAETK